jgi:TPR repeat protein
MLRLALINVGMAMIWAASTFGSFASEVAAQSLRQQSVVVGPAGVTVESRPTDPTEPREIFFRAIDYEIGTEVPRDFAEAARLYKLALSRGFQRAHGLLGRLYWEGWGVPQDRAEALRHYHAGIEAEYQWAQYFLATLYEFAEGVPHRPDEALRLYRLSAAQRNPRASTALALMILDGEFVEHDLNEARRLLEDAAPVSLAARGILRRLQGTNR